MSTWSTTDINTVLGKNDASSIVAASKKTTVTSATTDRGTKIVSGSEGFDKNSFLKLLSAQLSNLDPTADQDSTAYVTQMAQFSAMEQMYNLNETMSTFAYQQLIGKGVTMNIADSDGNAYTGVVRGVSKDASGTYLAVEVYENGTNTIKVFDATKLVSALESQDTSNATTALSSSFLTASALAKDNQKVVIQDVDDNDKSIIVKGKVKSAFIDNAIVKVRVEVLGKDGESTGEVKVYPYSYILKAGDLTDEDMDVKVEDIVDPDTSTGTEGLEATESTEDTDNETESDTTEDNNRSLTGNDNYKANADDIAKELKKLNSIAGI